jgi:tungstate transport system permease protein
MIPLPALLIAIPDEELQRVITITLLALSVSGLSTAISTLIGIPLGIWLGVKKGRFYLFLKTITHTLYGMPPVLAGLLFYLLLSRSGPLGPLGLLFTPTAMVLVQIFLVTPIIVGLTASAVGSLDPSIADTASSLGARGSRLLWTLGSEAKLGIMSAVMIGFGSAISEVGAVILVGGNIKWHTQVLTTAIVIETETGNIDFALMLGGILLTIAVITYTFLTLVQAREAGGKGPLSFRRRRKRGVGKN